MLTVMFMFFRDSATGEPSFSESGAPSGRIMSSLAGGGGLAHKGGIAGQGGGLAG